MSFFIFSVHLGTRFALYYMQQLREIVSPFHPPQLFISKKYFFDASFFTLPFFRSAEESHRKDDSFSPAVVFLFVTLQTIVVCGAFLLLSCALAAT